MLRKLALLEIIVLHMELNGFPFVFDREFPPTVSASGPADGTLR